MITKSCGVVHQGGGKKARKGSIAEHEKVMKFLERQRDRERDSGGV